MTVLRLIEVAHGETIGQEIRFTIDGHQDKIVGEIARNLLEEAAASEGLDDDLPVIVAGYLGQIYEKIDLIGAKWMTKEELKIHQQNQRTQSKLGQGISSG